MTLRRVTIALLVLYALLTVYPLISLALGASPSGMMTPVTTLIGLAFAILHAGQRLGWKRALLLLGLVFFISLLFESVGVATGWVYGPYHYTDKLGPRFLGLVPYLIPAAWFMMSYPSFVIADRLVPAGWKQWARLLGVAALGGLVMTAWDVIMDPIMVSGQHWIWDVEGAYFGIPLQNFWGWWLTVFTTFALYLLLTRRAADPRPGLAFDRLALLSYLVTEFGVVSVALIAGAGGLALVGFFAMTPWFVAGWLRSAEA
jgi:putative membrane protein